MWIRGQNKLTLQNVNRLVIEQFEIGIYIVGNGCTLGIYSTKEKALRVLDEIQAIVESKQFCVVDNVDLGNYVLHNGVQVYQMPQNEEDF